MALDGQCQMTELVYQAEVKRTDTQTVETYTGFKGVPSKRDLTNTCLTLESMKQQLPWDLKSQNAPYKTSKGEGFQSDH